MRYIKTFIVLLISVLFVLPADDFFINRIGFGTCAFKIEDMSSTSYMPYFHCEVSSGIDNVINFNIITRSTSKNLFTASEFKLIGFDVASQIFILSSWMGWENVSIIRNIAWSTGVFLGHSYFLQKKYLNKNNYIHSATLDKSIQLGSSSIIELRFDGNVAIRTNVMFGIARESQKAYSSMKCNALPIHYSFYQLLDVWIIYTINYKCAISGFYCAENRKEIFIFTENVPTKSLFVLNIIHRMGVALSLYEL